MSAPVIGIDFGSSRTKVARFNGSGTAELIEVGSEVRAVIPSMFYLPKNGGTILVGDEAVRMADSDPTGLISDIKNDVQRPGKVRSDTGRVTPERWELVAALFGNIRSRCEKEVFPRQSVETCVLTIPIGFTDAQRDKVRYAAEHVGFKTVHMVDARVTA